MKNYTLVTDAISRMNLISDKDGSRSHSSFSCAPLAKPENVDLGSEYAQASTVLIFY